MISTLKRLMKLTKREEMILTDFFFFFNREEKARRIRGQKVKKN